MPQTPSSGKFRVAGVQFCGRVGQWEENAARMRLWAQRARRRGCDLVLFPETSLTGYVVGLQNIAPTAQPAPGPGTDRLLAIARDLDIAISAGFSERAAEGFYLSQATALPDGRLHIYRKRFGGEAGYLHGGPTEPFVFRGLTIGVAICMDARIFELYREYAFQGVHLLLKPNCAWVGPWREDGLPDFAARAREHQRLMRVDWEKDCHFASANGMAMIAANAVGDTGARVVSGGAWFSDGRPGIRKSLPVVCEKARLRERMLVGELDPGALGSNREDPLLQSDLRMARLYYPS